MLVWLKLLLAGIVTGFAASRGRLARCLAMAAERQLFAADMMVRLRAWPMLCALMRLTSAFLAGGVASACVVRTLTSVLL